MRPQPRGPSPSPPPAGPGSRLGQAALIVAGLAGVRGEGLAGGAASHRLPASEQQEERAGRLMADALPESARGALDDPLAQLTGPLAGTTRLDFEVVDSARLT